MDAALKEIKTGQNQSINFGSNEKLVEKIIEMQKLQAYINNTHLSSIIKVLINNSKKRKR